MRKSSFLAYRSFYTPLNTIDKFNKHGYKTFCIFPAHTVNSRGTPYSQYPPTWIFLDKVDFHPLDEIIRHVSIAAPDSKFLCMIDLNSPQWLEHINPYTCCDTFNNLGKAVNNPDWMKATVTYLELFLDYVEKNYGDRIQAYMLACGATDEWYDYSQGNEDANRRTAWRAWCKEKGLPDPIDIPPCSKRDHYPHDDFLRDPQEDKVALDYWKFCNESIADTILKFAEITRKRIRPETQIGCFYGYILEKSEMCLVSCGHLEYEKVLDSEYIDFLISPATYTDRSMGGGSGFLIPDGTAGVRDKRLLHECDQRTHTYNPYLTPDIVLRNYCTPWPDEKSTVAGLKRETSLGLLKQTNLWWFDMWGDFYQGEAVMNVLQKATELWDKYNNGNDLKSVSEVAMIVDVESTYYINENHPDTRHVNVKMRNHLNRLGAPFDVFSFGDIPKIRDFSQYKLVIFTSLFVMTPEKKAILEKYVLNNNRSVLWMYAPGVIVDGKYNTANCTLLTGMDYGTSGTMKHAHWTSHYISDYKAVTPAILKQFAADAGVHLYTEKETPVYAAGNLLAVHTAEGDIDVVKVPGGYSKAKELYTDQEYPVINGELRYPFKTPDTALFELTTN